MQINADWLSERMMLLVPLWLSLTVHEWAHAWSAWRLGDDTAARLGRMTLNPLAHIDPIGTLLLPLLGVPFGWAKPVPIQPWRFRPGLNMRTGMMITAIAGPIANVCLAVVCLALLAAVAYFHATLGGAAQGIANLLRMLILLNVLLAVFNALPIPPLDGSRVADALVPDAMRPGWEQFCRMGPIVLAMVIILPHAVNADLFYWPMQAADFVIKQVIAWFGR